MVMSVNKTISWRNASILMVMVFSMQMRDKWESEFLLMNFLRAIKMTCIFLDLRSLRIRTKRMLII
jgi:hypothetical protein